MAQEDVQQCRELWCSNLWSLMPGVAPTVTQIGWAIVNKTADPATNRTHNCNATLDLVADTLGQLVDDLKAKGILSA